MTHPSLFTPPPPDAFLALPRTFYTRDALTVAKDLLGRFLVHDSPEGRTVGRIVETEAYTGVEDKAAHVYQGKRTERTEVFWNEGGHAYVYQIYGMHHCMNVVTGERDDPHAVLLRAMEPVEGLDLMEQRRAKSLDASDISDRLGEMANLMNGPGKLCQSMGIRKDIHYGHDLTTPPLQLTKGRPPEPNDVTTGPRVNIDYAEEYAPLPYRFWVQSSPCVSKP